MEIPLASETTEPEPTPPPSAPSVTSCTAARIVARTSGIGAGVIAGSHPRERQPGGRRQPVTGQAPSESFPASGEPALDRPDGALQVPRRLLVAAALDIAEHDGHPVSVGEAIDLRMDQAGDFVIDRLVRD